MLAAAAVLPAAPAAHADDHSYGEQIAIADAASVAVLVGTKSPPVGLAGYALLAPAVHVAHGQGDRAAVSLAMRLIPVASAATLDRCEGGEAALGCGLGHIGLGVLGALVVTAVDVFVVADGEAPAMMAPILGARF